MIPSNQGQKRGWLLLVGDAAEDENENDEEEGEEEAGSDQKR